MLSSQMNLGKILDSSAPFNTFKKYIEVPLTPIPSDGQILEDKWDQEPYIATVSPIKIDHKSFLVMFICFKIPHLFVL